MGWLQDTFNPGKGYEKAGKEQEKYYQQAQAYQQPYIQQGQSAYGNLSQILQNLMNPNALEANWLSTYEESPSAKHAEQLASERGLNAAQAQGLGGSSSALQALQQGTSQIALNDRENYLSRLMQQYLSGAGIAGNLYNSGANASNAASNNAMSFGQDAAGYKFNEVNAGGNMIRGILGQLAGGVGTAFAEPYASKAANNMAGTNQSRWSTGG